MVRIPRAPVHYELMCRVYPCQSKNGLPRKAKHALTPLLRRDKRTEARKPLPRLTRGDGRRNQTWETPLCPAGLFLAGTALNAFRGFLIPLDFKGKGSEDAILA